MTEPKKATGADHDWAPLSSIFPGSTMTDVIQCRACGEIWSALTKDEKCRAKKRAVKR